MQSVKSFAVITLLYSASIARADLFVGSFFGDQVLRYNESTGALIGTAASGGGLDGPQGMVFDPLGRLLVASQENSTIQM